MTATTVPRKHRKDNREAERNLEDEFASLEHEVLADLEGRPAPAEQLTGRVSWRDRERLPVARPVMKDPRGEIAWALGHVGNRAGHHFFRADLHAHRYLCAIGRGVRRGHRRVNDYVQMPTRKAALVRLVAEGETKRHAKLAVSYEKRKKRHKDKVLRAAGATAAGLVVVVGLLASVLGRDEIDADLGTVAWNWAEAAVLFLAAAVMPALAIYGRRHGTGAAGATARPVKADTRPVPRSDPRPTADAIHAAFAAAGIPDIVCEIAPHREGPGWETLVRIPVGAKTFTDAVKAHAAIAGNLGVGSECLFLTPVRGIGGSTKHVRVWWTKTDPFAGDPPPHPLLDPRSVPVDLWNSGLPIGLDVRGTIARIALVDTPFVAVIGQPGAGKTFLDFGIGAAVAADPLWDLDAWAFKSSGSFAPLKPLVTACGGTYDYGADPKTFDRFYRYLIRLRNEIAERNERLDALPIERNPRDKVERDVAADPGSGLRPRVVLADEIITAIEGDSRILPVLEEIGRTARSQHIVFVLGAQFADSETFKNLQKLLGSRVVLSVARHNDAEMALGGDHVPGLTDAHRIPLTAKGVAYLAGAIVDPEIGPRPAFKIRTFGIDRQLLAEHVRRCLAGCRAGQSKVQLAKADPEAEAVKARLRGAMNGDEALTCTVLGERLELGVGPVAAKKMAEQARAAGVEPRKDTTGNVTGKREALYVHREQLN